MRASLGALLAFATLAVAVKEGDFRKCKDSGFCRRGRALASRASEAAKKWHSPYSIQRSSINASPAGFIADLKSEIYPDVKFELEIRVHEDGVIRVRADEVGGLRKRYDEAASWALIRDPSLAEPGKINWKIGKYDITGSYRGRDIQVTYNPLKIVLLQGGQEDIVLNGEGLLHLEHSRQKPRDEEAVALPVEGAAAGGSDQVVMERPKSSPSVKAAAWFEGDEEDAYWEETFNSWTDSKPKGPESLSIDVSFPGHAHVYGIPQHAAPLSLPATTGPDAFFDDPYRLWNLDVFEYEVNSTMSLYGSIPLLHAHSARSTVGIFNAVASETWIDVSHPKPKSTLTHWISESGILDIFLLPGPTPEEIFAQYARLTGAPVLPAHWALAYHQCRWNYVSSTDIREVQAKFDEEDFPLDVLWLDIEYSEDHKYMIWKDDAFPDPVDMINDVAAYERKMVIIVDPHLKRVDSYPVYKEAKEGDLLVKKSDESEYAGHCWSGDSAWTDFFNPETWSWWQGLFSLTAKEGVKWRWEKSTSSVFIWNDMNEPSVFNGPEITMQKDNIHYGGWEHRDVHNINGMLFHNHTAQAVRNRGDAPVRPFVLSRSFYAGSQRHGAIWTGDNAASWESMTIGIPMVLSDGIAGMSFSGADVGGFFGNPGPELVTRWYQLGAFNPFFRAHAHIDTKRREPYLLEEPYKSIVRDIIRLRYSLLPVWYTAFREASVTGLPVLRPQYVVFPKDSKGFAIDDQFYVGSSGLLVKPITKEGSTEGNVYLAEDQIYYDYFSYDTYRGTTKGTTVTVPAPLEKFPLLIRGGSILPTRQRLRRSSPLMRYDPFTLTIALNTGGDARGELYLDDGESYAHETGDLVWREFKAVAGKTVIITGTDLARQKGSEAVDGTSLVNIYSESNPFASKIKDVTVEKVIVLGLTVEPVKVTLGGSGAELEWDFTKGTKTRASVLIIKNPKTKITEDWKIVIA